jgi:hypothetical protein
MFFVSLIQSAQAQTSISTPSVPEFTVKYVDNSYYVPPTYGVDQYTGNNVTVKKGYTVNGENIVFTIENQQFTPYIDSSGNTISLYYNFRYKGHFGSQWSYYPFGPDGRTVLPYNGQPWGSGDLSPKYPSSNADTTVISIAKQILDIRGAPEGSPIDVQLQAMEGHIDIEVTGLAAGDYYNFVGQTSDWSSTQTITIGDNGVTATPYVASSTPANTTVPTDSSGFQTPAIFGLDWAEIVIIALLAIIAIFLAVAIFFLHKRSPRLTEP